MAAGGRCDCGVSCCCGGGGGDCGRYVGKKLGAVEAGSGPRPWLKELLVVADAVGSDAGATWTG